MEVHKFGGMSLTTTKIYRAVVDLLISESDFCYIGFEVNDNVEVKVDSGVCFVLVEADINFYIDMTNMNSNTSTYPVMTVV